MGKRILTILLAIALISDLAFCGDWKPYFGLLHAHTSYSDGDGTPDEAYKYAKEAGLDFFAVTDHNHDKAGGSDGTYLTQARYELTQKAAKKHTKNGEFVAICGQEFSTISSGNHVNIFEWCSDYYDKDYYSNSPSVDPKGPSRGAGHSFRGGSWFYDASYLRSSKQYGSGILNRCDFVGFRVVRSKS